MTTTANGVDYMSAPQDYAALYRDYYTYTVNLVAKNGINENDKEDVAADILLRLMERGILERFDPTLIFEFEGEKRPARFRTYLSRAVLTYVKGYRDKQMRLHRRELQICDTPSGDLNPNRQFPLDSSTWIDNYAARTRHHEDHADAVLEMMVEEQEADGIRAYLRDVPKRSPHDTCDLVALFNAVRAQGLAHGECDIAALETTFGICTTTLYNWIWWLRVHIAHLYGREVPAKRRRAANRKKAEQ